VFAADPNAFLRVCSPRIRAFALTKENVLELVHPGISEQEGGIVVRNDW